MKSRKDLLLGLAVVLWISTVFLACNSKQPQSRETNKTEQQDKQGSMINSLPFKVTPIQSEILSTDEPVSITVSDTLNLRELDISTNELLDYSIYLYVHPLNAEGWWRQNPATASKQWTTQAYLGGKDQHRARDGEVFEIVAILARQSLPEKVSGLNILRNIEGVRIISEKRTMIVRRR